LCLNPQTKLWCTPSLFFNKKLFVWVGGSLALCVRVEQYMARVSSQCRGQECMEITSTLPYLLRVGVGLGTGMALMLLIRSRTEGYAGIYDINKLNKLIIQNKYWRKEKFYERVLVCAVTFNSSPSSSSSDLKSQQPGCCHSILYQHGFSSAFFFHQLLTTINFSFFLCF